MDINLLGKKTISIVSPFSRYEIENPSFGGPSLIQMQKRYFDKKGLHTNMIYLCEIKSPTSYFLNIKSKIRKNSMYAIKKDVTKRWCLNLLFCIFIDIFSRIDLLLKKELTAILKNSQSEIVLCNYPSFCETFFSISNKTNIKCILFEHNSEYYFYEQILNDSKLTRLLLNIFKKIELSAIKKSYMTLVVTPNDRDIILKDIGRRYDSKIIYWIPFEYNDEKYTKKKVEDIQNETFIEDKQFYMNIKNKTIIGFVGAYFEPNIAAVENIIKIAMDNKNITFLILGKVCEEFNDRLDIPDNVIMKGFVRNLDFYLSICDAFINPKTTSDTGIEIKMFDYLRFGKPIVSTEIGARGFEEYGMNIVSVAEFSRELSKILNL